MLSEDYQRLREAIEALRDAAAVLENVEVAEIRFKGSRRAMYEFHRKLIMETPAEYMLRSADNPKEMIVLDGVSLTKTVNPRAS